MVGGWREWSDGVVQTHAVVPITPPSYAAQCCDHPGPSSNAANCPTDMSTPTRSPVGVTSHHSPGPGSPATTMMPRSCATCQSSRGASLDNNFYPFGPPGALFNPFFPPFAMHPQPAAAAGFPFPPPGLAPEPFLGAEPARANDCSVHGMTENGVAAAAALQYQNESESFHHHPQFCIHICSR